MSISNEKMSLSKEEGKEQVLQELGDVVITGEVLSDNEDRRILRRIDMQYGDRYAFSQV